jgi:O-antigen ligase
MSAFSRLYNSVVNAKVRATLTALLVFLLPFERIPSIDAFSVTIRASQLVALALVLASIGPLIEFYKARPRLPRLLLPAFLLSYAISATMSSDLKRATMVFVFTVFVALVASAIAATFTDSQLPRIEKYLYASTVIVLIVGFYQYFGDVFGLNTALTGLRDIYTKEVFGFPRIQSTALEPLYYGSFLLIPYCLLLAKRFIRPKTVTPYHTLLFVLIVSQLLLTVSRGAIYSAIVVTTVLLGYVVIARKSNLLAVLKSIGLLAVGVIIGLTLTWLPTFFVSNAKETGGQKTEKLIDQAANFNSQDDRVRNRMIAIHAFKQEPLLGVGPGGFSAYAIEVFPKYGPAAPVIVNNEPLELLAEAGIIGFILFTIFAGWNWLLVATGYIKDKFKNQQSIYWAPALLVYCIALAIQYQTFSTLYVMHVWVVIGLLMAFARQQLPKD